MFDDIRNEILSLADAAKWLRSGCAMSSRMKWRASSEIGPSYSQADGGARCLIPRFDGAILYLEWKDALWDKFAMAAPRPRTLSEQQYSDRKLRSRN
nr:hypothetical protein [Paracoccus sp. MKU1]